jgi:hypothetical protein
LLIVVLRSLVFPSPEWFLPTFFWAQHTKTGHTILIHFALVQFAPSEGLVDVSCSAIEQVFSCPMIGPKSNWASWRVECCKKWMTAILQISWMIKLHNFQTVFVGIKTQKTLQLRGQFR